MKRTLFVITLALLALVNAVSLAMASQFAVLHTFSGPDGMDALTQLSLYGNTLYGTTYQGGSHYGVDGDVGAGTVFSLDTSGNNFTTLYSFTGTDGQYPVGHLQQDQNGKLLGTTTGGGPNKLGILFKLDPTNNQLTTLHSFYGIDGAAPVASPVMDSKGTLYGTTFWGGASFTALSEQSAYGTLWKLDALGNYTVLHSFEGTSTDGYGPLDSLVFDTHGNAYGVTLYGGPVAGTVFKVTPSGQYSVIHIFDGNTGNDAFGGLTIDSNGNLYGTALAGGKYNCGVIYRIESKSNSYKVLYNFSGGKDGQAPYGALVRDAKGNLYGVTGAYDYLNPSGTAKYGTVYKLDTSNHLTTLYTFQNGTDGAFPQNGLAMDSSGNLYGATRFGGANNLGVVFKVTP